MTKELVERVKSADKAFFIRLGVGGGLTEKCIKNGHLVIGHPEVSHKMASLVYESPQHEVRNIIRQEFQKCLGGSAQRAGRYPPQVMDFYTGGDYHSEGAGTGKNTLWITFWNMRLWWTFAEGRAKSGRDLPKGSYPGADYSKGSGPRRPGGYHWRETTGWRYKSLAGDALFFVNVGGCVTKSRGTRGTLCAIHDGADNGYPRRHLKCLILGEEDREIAPWKSLRDDKLKRESARVLLVRLNAWQTERLVDKLFEKQGWKRVSPLGGQQPVTDFIARRGNSLALVQVKSGASQDRYNGFRDQVRHIVNGGKEGECVPYFAHHSGVITPGDGDGVKIWDREKLLNEILSDESGEVYEWMRRRVG
ncbi:MAG: hypothetical protein MPJ22_11160 [Pirellulales bacterium]|nr:hypothetical protein [Alphaproteobacteria bacterium]MDA8031832.1 hypothetical protein [Alphaproteobacteria bacterium]MDA8042964.1 hypothetical protein [Pirellulales bacterium]